MESLRFAGFSWIISIIFDTISDTNCLELVDGMVTGILVASAEQFLTSLGEEFVLKELLEFCTVDGCRDAVDDGGGARGSGTRRGF